MSIQTGFHHVALKVCGEERFYKTLEFYEHVLMCPVRHQWSTNGHPRAMLDLGGALMELMEGEREDAEGILPHFAFASDDVDQAIECVRAAGCTVTMEPCNKNLGGDYPIRIAFFTGPAGEKIEFFNRQ